MQLQHHFVLFADIKGFSKIKDDELPDVMGDVWSHVAKILEPHKEEIFTYNTWGDALFLVFKRASVVSAVLELRDWFQNHNKLAIRIACHFGDFYEYKDPVLGRLNAVGANINLAARIEPITRPNSVFVTKAFKESLQNAKDPGKPDVEFDPLGEIELAKEFGEEELFLLRRKGEARHILDRLAKMDLASALPDIDPMTADEQKQIKLLKEAPGSFLPTHDDFNRENAAFGWSLAELHQAAGNYDTANTIVEKLINVTLEADGLTVAPLEQAHKFVKLRANNATRRGAFDEAHRLLYGLYKSGAQDTDTLTMLASCYKRRAFFDSDGNQHENPVKAMLERSRDLYLEAVRKDVGDYYPVINSAYAHAFLKEDGIANKLADYCRDLLCKTHDENWWAASTYAEAEVVRSDYKIADEELSKSIEDHKPSSFQIDSLVDQLKLLAIVRNSEGLNQLIENLKANVA